MKAISIIIKRNRTSKRQRFFKFSIRLLLRLNSKVGSDSELCMGRPWDPIEKSKSHGLHGAPLGKLQIQTKFSETRCISSESFSISALIPMKNIVILKLVLDLFEVF